MRLNKNKHLFTIITNEAGRILELSPFATTILQGVCIGDDVFSLVDASELRKLSMHDSMAIVRKSTLEAFPVVIMRTMLDGHIKMVELCFISKSIVIKDALADAERVLSLYAEKRSTLAKISPYEYIKELALALAERKEVRGIEAFISGKTRELLINPVSLELIFFVTVSMLLDINFKSKIEISIENEKITFSIISNELNVASEQEFFKQYPQTISRLNLVRSICEDDEIEVDLSINDGKITIEYNLASFSRGTISLGALTSTLAQRISRFIDILFA